MSDKAIADIARRLALTLSLFARERRPEDSKAIAILQTELCAAVRAEADEPPPASEPAKG
jgi:hypothetical protein